MTSTSRTRPPSAQRRRADASIAQAQTATGAPSAREARIARPVRNDSVTAGCGVAVPFFRPATHGAGVATRVGRRRGGAGGRPPGRCCRSERTPFMSARGATPATSASNAALIATAGVDASGLVGRARTAMIWLF